MEDDEESKHSSKNEEKEVKIDSVDLGEPSHDCESEQDAKEEQEQMTPRPKMICSGKYWWLIIG